MAALRLAHVQDLLLAHALNQAWDASACRDGYVFFPRPPLLPNRLWAVSRSGVQLTTPLGAACDYGTLGHWVCRPPCSSSSWWPASWNFMPDSVRDRVGNVQCSIAGWSVRWAQGCWHCGLRNRLALRYSQLFLYMHLVIRLCEPNCTALAMRCRLEPVTGHNVLHGSEQVVGTGSLHGLWLSVLSGWVPQSRCWPRTTSRHPLQAT